MKGNRITLALALCVSCLCACVQIDDSYNMKSNLRLDMGFDLDGLTVPAGNLDTIYVDSIMKVETGQSRSVLQLFEDGLYGFLIEGSTDELSMGIETVEESFAVKLDEDYEFLRDSISEIGLSNVQISLDFSTTAPVPMELSLSVSSKDRDGKWICRDLTPYSGTVTVPACRAGQDRREMVLYIYSDDIRQHESDDTVFVRVGNLTDIISQVPDSVFVKLTASANGQEFDGMDRDDILYLDGDYSVRLPLEFKYVDVRYTDTISGLGEDLADISENCRSFEATVNAKAKNTIPLGVELKAWAIDAAGNPIPGIVLSSVNLNAGNGNSPSSTDIEFKISVQDGSFNRIDGLVFTARCMTDGSTGSKTLKSGDYIYISDISLVLDGNVEFDFTDDDGDNE